jgi:hypothetical protein
MEAVMNSGNRQRRKKYVPRTSSAEVWRLYKLAEDDQYRAAKRGIVGDAEWDTMQDNKRQAYEVFLFLASIIVLSILNKLL